MECKYWKDIVRLLYDPERRSWAAHVLATELEFKDTLKESKLGEIELSEVNLGIALQCVSQEEIIEGTIYAYSDGWYAQSNCDLILVQFDEDKIMKVFESIKQPDPDMKKGVERFLEILKEES